MVRIVEPNANTKFASPERDDASALLGLSTFIAKEINKNLILDAIPDILTILNEHRQVVYANTRLYQLLGFEAKDIIGKRPGEIFNCIHAEESEAGCGTTEFCRECGAARSILTAQFQKEESVQECRLLTTSGNAFDLRVWSSPIKILGKEYVVFSIKDIQHEKRREALERTFFHDVLNTAGNILNASGLMKLKQQNQEQFLEIINSSSEQLVDEIRSHHQLVAAERGDLVAEKEPIDCKTFLESISNNFCCNDLSQGVGISIHIDPEVDTITTDKSLLSRVLCNLMKNALEASRPEDAVHMKCEKVESAIQFSLSNPAFMPRKVQLQVFQRSFSTKGKGRGIGTFGARLLTEQYLGGKIWFESSKKGGTTFYVSIPQ